MSCPYFYWINPSGFNLRSSSRIQEIDKSEWYYQITVPSTYKSILALTLSDPDFYNSNYKDADYHLNVLPIKYHKGKAKLKIPNQEELTPFHYLADIVCGIILQKIYDVTDKKTIKIDSRRLEEISNIKLSDTIQIPLELRTLDECEQIFRKMIKAIHKIDLVQYYEAAYELKNINEEKLELNTKEFYINYWLKKADTFLAKRMTEDHYCNAVVRRLPEYCNVLKRYMTADVKYAVGLYVAENLMQQITNLDEKSKNPLGHIIFTLYDICLQGYNHEGSNERAAQVIAQAEYYAQSVSLDDYIGYSIRCLQYYFNRLDYTAALEKASNLESLAKPYLATCQQLYAKSKEIVNSIAFPSNSMNNQSSGLIAKIYSNIGQACSYLTQEGNKQENFAPKIGELSARKAFKMALDIYNNLNDRENYSISLSHYLHFLFHIKNKTEYEEYAPLYFGSNDLVEQFNMIKQMENKFSARFYLRVYIKSLLVFYPKIFDWKTNSGIATDIINYIEENYQDEHPWSLICANLYENLWKNAKEKDRALDSKYDIYYKRATLITKQRKEDQDTIDIIKLRFKIHMALLNDSSLADNDAVSYLEPSDFFIIEKLNIKEYDKNKSILLNNLYTLLNKYVCYEYC